MWPKRKVKEISIRHRLTPSSHSPTPLAAPPTNPSTNLAYFCPLSPSNILPVHCTIPPFAIVAVSVVEVEVCRERIMTPLTDLYADNLANVDSISGGIAVDVGAGERLSLP
jgi:hypothetical protein